jgi:hypothetical protein
MVLALGAGVTSTGPAAASAAGLTLVSAPQRVAPAARINLEVRLPEGTLPPDSVKVSVRPVGDSVNDLLAALDDTNGDPVDAVTLTGAAITSNNDLLGITVLTETSNRQSNLLSLAREGTYVLRVTVPSVGSLTFPLLRGRDRELPPVPVTMVLNVDAPLSIQPDGSRSISDSTRTSVRALAGFLASATIPVAVSIRPELVDSLARSEQASDREIIDALAASFGRQRLLSAPYLHIDPSAAANGEAAADFTTQLRLGEDTLSNALRRLPDRRIWVATEPLTPAGAQLVRNLGAAVIIQAAGEARDQNSATASVAESDVQPVLQPVNIDRLLAGTTSDPVRIAQTIAVGLLRSTQTELRPTIVLMPDLGTANPAVLDALVALISHSGSLQAADIEQVGVGTRPELPSETLPIVTDFSAAHARRAKLLKAVTATAAILPSSDQRRVAWMIRADVLLDTRLADDDRAAYETQLRAAVLDVQNNVLLQAPRAVNLGDRNANIPLTVQNNNDVPVTVMVRLVSGKLRVPQESKIVTVEPGATEFINISVKALSSGRFPVTAQLVAPGTKTVVGKSAIMNVRVGRFTGLGIAVTFAAGLVLLSWWVQHFRRKLRKEETAELERRKLAGLPIDEVDDILVDTSAQTERPGATRKRAPRT